MTQAPPRMTSAELDTAQALLNEKMGRVERAARHDAVLPSEFETEMAAALEFATITVPITMFGKLIAQARLPEATPQAAEPGGGLLDAKTVETLIEVRKFYQWSSSTFGRDAAQAISTALNLLSSNHAPIAEATPSSELSQYLRQGLAEMAANASVPMDLWDRFSNDVLMAADALAALQQPAVFPAGDRGWRPTHRHVKRGTSYRLVAVAELQCAGSIREGAKLAIYEAEDCKDWARPWDEFNDGRFEELPAPPADDIAVEGGDKP